MCDKQHSALHVRACVCVCVCDLLVHLLILVFLLLLALLATLALRAGNVIVAAIIHVLVTARIDDRCARSHQALTKKDS